MQLKSYYHQKTKNIHTRALPNNFISPAALSTEHTGSNSIIGQQHNYAEDTPSAASQIDEFDMMNTINYQPTLYTSMKVGNQVALHNGTREFCGGTVLDARHVITSVKCVYYAHHPISGPLYVVTATGKVAGEAQMMYVPKDYHESVLLSKDIAVLKVGERQNH